MEAGFLSQDMFQDDDSFMLDRTVRVMLLIVMFCCVFSLIQCRVSWRLVKRLVKWLRMMFNPVGSLVGAGIKTFLLESSRVVSQQKGEKNYHVFYELLAGMEEEVAGIPHVVSPKKPQKTKSPVGDYSIHPIYGNIGDSFFVYHLTRLWRSTWKLWGTWSVYDPYSIQISHTWNPLKSSLHHIFHRFS